MNPKKKITPSYLFEKTTYVKFIDHKNFRMAKYYDISLEGFSCFCNKKMELGDKYTVEINLKMISGGLIDDLIPHVAVAELIGKEEVNDHSVYRFVYIKFSENCFDNLAKAVDYLDKKQKLISLPEVSKNNIEAEETIENMVEFISKNITSGQIELPVLPTIVQNLSKVINKPNSTNEDMAKIIETDAVISVKILAIVNSAFYRGDSHIVTIKDAIPRLGITEIQNLVMTISSKSIYNTKNIQFKNLLEKLWIHSLATAEIARSTAEELSIPESETFFTMGIIHEIGRTMLLRVMGEMTSDATSFTTDEIVNSTNNNIHKLTGKILKYWEFPKPFIYIVVNYKNENISNEEEKEILVLKTADLLAEFIGYDLIKGKNKIDYQTAAETLDISVKTIENICENTIFKIKESASAFN